MTGPALDVIELMLTARVYNEDTARDPGDLPPSYRRAFWRTAATDDSDADTETPTPEEAPGDGDRRAPGSIQRPLTVTGTRISEATGIAHPWDAVSELLFTQREEFTGELSFSDAEMAEQWYLKRTDSDRLMTNPTLARYFESDVEDVDYEAARSMNRPIHADRVWIDSLLEQVFDEEDEEMLDLVEVRAPQEMEMTLDDLVLTSNQEAEIQKIVKAIEHREYLAEIGLREIGKLLLVGPPGTGKTSVARALAHGLELPFVEVKLSMITSQYLGETAKNVDKAFEVAKRLAPCIFFMDEFDFVAKTRSSDEHAAIKRAVNTLLKSIDEVSLIRDDVLLIGATNHPDQLDAAAWRRFDEIVNFPKPDSQMRADILRVITRKMDIENFDPEAVANKTEGLTGSDLRLVLREAVLNALTEERTTLTQDDLLTAVEGFEERDNLKNMDMINGDADALIAGSGSTDTGHDHAHDHAHSSDD
ncbi:ATP-binding protein [Halocatena pleomorpha]|uniref:ATP-binding protein n=1 Tax=Halocatena pleomorpha TaxID=1785090 RepID=A0A3P3RBX1_9EURY|nr:ATP-binding protein [Halocatena pleomorpha]RRJ30977.1 ATP-binding protein [Halocatena pleomorpha]